LISARGDARLLGRAVDNVVANAMQYSTAGGEVVIESHYTPPPDDAWVTLFGGAVRVLSSSPEGSTFELQMRGGEARNREPGTGNLERGT
jgi:hypothetical protein